ncbi:MAG: TIGR00153 family protein [Alphaproteobacteria bacterium]|nr:MAG: TIGR00153 family protein [Alphaproteobacteria bacterium]
MATKSTISGLFGRSPIRPLQQHMAIVTEAAKQVVDLFEALCASQWKEADTIVDKISSLESEADEVKNELRAHLPKSLFMPMDRRDILEILDLQDNIADIAQSIGGITRERRMEVPPSLAKPLMTLIRRCVDACKHCDKTINELDELLATGFRGRESDMVHTMVEELNKIESDTDLMGTDLARSLFAIEDELSPVSVMLWYQLIQMIGGLADNAERVGNRLRLLTAR